MHAHFEKVYGIIMFKKITCKPSKSYVTVLCLLLLILYCFVVVLVVVDAVLLVLTTKMLLYGPNVNLWRVYFTSVLLNCGRPVAGHL